MNNIITLNPTSAQIIENDDYIQYSIKAITSGILIETSKDEIHKSKLKLETYEEYLKLDIKDILKEKNWIYNIIDHKAEQKSIIFEDDNIIIIPDYKWNNNINELHVLGIFKDKSLRSIRDLNSTHIKILKETIQIGCSIINKKYDVKLDNILTFFHYHPSTWQLHIHFMNINDQKTRSCILPRAYLCSTVIQNLELIPDYYKKIKLEVYD